MRPSSGGGRLVELNAQAVSHFFVGFDQAAKALAEAVFVHFIEGVFIPQAAAVRRKLVAQHHFAFEQTKLQLKVHQNQTGVIEQFFSTSLAL